MKTFRSIIAWPFLAISAPLIWFGKDQYDLTFRQALRNPGAGLFLLGVIIFMFSDWIVDGPLTEETKREWF